jgi:hypothetical protein
MPPTWSWPAPRAALPHAHPRRSAPARSQKRRQTRTCRVR